MIRKDVNSSNIKSVGYDPTLKILEVEFDNSGIYQYLNVPENIYINLMNASSHGVYLNQFIKDKYSYREVSH